MKDKKEYGIVIPKGLSASKWNKLTPEEILALLKDLNKDAFYRMAEDADVDLVLLKSSGYEYSGISELALIELEVFLPKKKAESVRKLVGREEYSKNEDFSYVLHLYNDKTNIINELFDETTANQLLKFRELTLRGDRKIELDLKQLFIDEFSEKKTKARTEVLKKYGGHFIDISELNSFLYHRDYISWFKGDTFDNDYENTIQKLKSLQEFVKLYQLISEDDELQIQSTKYAHNKFIINGRTLDLLLNAVAFTLKVHNDTDGDINPLTEQKKKYWWFELGVAKETSQEAIEELIEKIESMLDSYSSESNLNLFYYLADNAISWPKKISQTQRYVFLYKLAIFFKHLEARAYGDLNNAYVRKEITDKIRYIIKTMKDSDPDQELLDQNFEDKYLD